MSTLATARRLLDLGAGPGTFAARAAARPHGLTVIALDPSRDFARTRPGTRTQVVRAGGEALPLGSGSIDAAICLSSIRHVRDRAATLRELRRVVHAQGSLVVVELDPEASREQIAAHAEHLGSALLRHAFGPLVCKTAPPASTIVELATAAGWQLVSQRRDPIQPVYILELA
jgi:ubiquinone/menaquinone biosynthesis C-methylase UbiE